MQKNYKIPWSQSVLKMDAVNSVFDDQIIFTLTLMNNKVRVILEKINCIVLGSWKRIRKNSYNN